MALSYDDLVAAFNSVTVTFPDTGPIRATAQSFVNTIARRWAEIVPGRDIDSCWARYYIAWIGLRYGETFPAVLLHDLWLRSRPYQPFHEIMAPPNLPVFLTTAWQFQQRGIKAPVQEYFEFCHNMNLSNLVMAQIIHQTTAYEKLLADQELFYRSHGRNSTGLGARSLLAMSAGQLISLLENSDEFNLDLATLATNINPFVVLAFLRDSRLPYVALRSFMTLSDEHVHSAEVAEIARSKIDIDEAILANEAYIRSRGGTRNKDNKGLVSLADAEVIFGNSSLKFNKATGQTYRAIVRKDPPKGGFEFFDAKRPRILRIQPSQEAFNTTFNRLTRDILKDLNWDNVFIAGGMALTTLLHVDPARDGEVQDNDIDLYIYGLTAAKANEKVREIYNVWSANLPAGNNQKLIVKNVKTITFLADYPNRRIQIILKIVPCPTTVLLNFDLDPCAMGFDGKNVLMLPRCARALETGYSTFTMDLLWGHHLGDRRATQPARVFKYADRGFGIRILPSYVKSLEEGDPIMETSLYIEGRGLPDRRLDKKEPGLKTLKRIEYLGKDMLHRYYFGMTPLIVRPDWIDEEEWRTRLESHESEMQANESEGGEVRIPLINLSEIDTRGAYTSIPNGRRSVGGFELWMRHHEAWRLDSLGKAILQKDSLSVNVYDADAYDDLPSYEWNSKFDAEIFKKKIDNANQELFEWLKYKICGQLSISYHQSGWRDYLTRRIRRQVYGADIDDIFEKQITIPIEIPFELEDFIHTIVDTVLEKEDIYNGNEGERLLLIPVHEFGRGNGIIPDLEPNAEANLRYWVIGNELMWAGIDRSIDEIFEALWTIFHAGKKDTQETDVQVALAFRSRLPKTFDLRPLKTAIAELKASHAADTAQSSTAADTTATPAPDSESPGQTPSASSLPTNPPSAPTPTTISPTPLKRPSTLSEAEKRLFQQWAFHVPINCEEHRRYNDPPNELWSDGGFVYPFEDGLFWGPREEEAAKWGGGVEWVEVPAEEICWGEGEVDVGEADEGAEMGGQGEGGKIGGEEGGKESQGEEGLVLMGAGGKRKRSSS